MDWSEVSGIAASIAAVATFVGVIVAAYALKYARRAAQEAGRQVKASLDSAKAAQDAAKAAQDQVVLLEKQLSFSEPKPVLLLRCSWNDPFLELENVGEDLAFDAQVNLLERDWLFTHESLWPFDDMIFDKEFVVRRGIPTPLRLMRHNEMLPTSELRKFLETLVPIGNARAEGLGWYSKMRPQLARFSLTYKNIRQTEFSGTFVLNLTHFGKNIECSSEGSLINPN